MWNYLVRFPYRVTVAACVCIWGIDLIRWSLMLDKGRIPLDTAYAVAQAVGTLAFFEYCHQWLSREVEANRRKFIFLLALVLPTVLLTWARLAAGMQRTAWW